MARVTSRCQTRPVTSRWADSPRTSIARYCNLVGEHALITSLIGLLNGDELSADLGEVLAGPASRTVLAGGEGVLAGGEGGPAGYWARVWALRGLLYVFEERAVPSVVAATTDPAWRVREMALKVIARHRLDEALEAAARCQVDDVARVRAGAARALARLVSAGTDPR